MRKWLRWMYDKRCRGCIAHGTDCIDSCEVDKDGFRHYVDNRPSAAESKKAPPRVEEIPPYIEIDVIDALGPTVAAHRRARQLTLREAEEESGIGFSTISRVERGVTVNAKTLIALYRWCGYKVILKKVDRSI